MRTQIKENIARSQQITADMEKIAQGTMSISEQRWNGAAIDSDKTAEEWCSEYAWREPGTGLIEKPRLWIAGLCIKLTGDEDDEYWDHRDAVMATTCGSPVLKKEKALSSERLDKDNLKRTLRVMKSRVQVETSHLEMSRVCRKKRNAMGFKGLARNAKPSFCACQAGQRAATRTRKMPKAWTLQRLRVLREEKRGRQP